MTIGIYALYWAEQDLIYIGQSQNIEHRFIEHMCLLKNGKHTNYKVQNAYDSYGSPDLNIISVTKVTNLNREEIWWTEEFASLNSPSGLNIIEPGVVGWGVNSNNSRYSLRQVLSVFSLLYSSDNAYSTIAKRTGVSRSAITDIKNGVSHLWLKEKYPEQFLLMCTRTGASNQITIFAKTGILKYIKSPQDDLYEIKSIKTFCESIPEFTVNLHASTTGIGRVLSGSRASYRGWKLP